VSGIGIKHRPLWSQNAAFAGGRVDVRLALNTGHLATARHVGLVPEAGSCTAANSVSIR